MKNKDLVFAVDSVIQAQQGVVSVAGRTFKITACTLAGCNRTIVEVFVGITPIIRLDTISALRGVLHKTVAMLIEDYLTLVEKLTYEEIVSAEVEGTY